MIINTPCFGFEIIIGLKPRCFVFNCAQIYSQIVLFRIFPSACHVLQNSKCALPVSSSSPSASASTPMPLIFFTPVPVHSCRIPIHVPRTQVSPANPHPVRTYAHSHTVSEPRSPSGTSTSPLHSHTAPSQKARDSASCGIPGLTRIVSLVLTVQHTLAAVPPHFRRQHAFLVCVRICACPYPLVYCRREEKSTVLSSAKNRIVFPVVPYTRMVSAICPSR